MSPLTLLFQDEFLVAIDKPAGMLVHPGRDADGPEWVAMKCLRDQLGCRVFPIHRLDRPTSGVLLFALDKQTAGLSQQAFEARRVSKVYQAIVSGKTPERWVCDSPLAADSAAVPLAAETAFELLAMVPAGAFPEDLALSLTLLQAIPVTGRFHQIRRHLLEAGFPIIGDFRYGGMERGYRLGEVLGIGTRMLLQSKSLDLVHPRTGEPLHIEASADADFLKCCQHAEVT